MITVTLNPDEIRDVLYALKVGEDDLRLKAQILERADMPAVKRSDSMERARAALRVGNRLRQVRTRIESAAVPASERTYGGQCIHGVLFSVPCTRCLEYVERGFPGGAGGGGGSVGLGTENGGAGGAGKFCFLRRLK